MGRGGGRLEPAGVVIDEQAERELPQQQERAEAREHAHRPAPCDEGERAAEGIERQYVAGPDQISVDEADREQARGARIMDPRGAFAARQRAFGDEHRRGAEQHREQPAHLAVGEDEDDRPAPPVRAFRAAGEMRVDIGISGQRERNDVEQQDAHHRHPAYRVQRRNSRRRRLFTIDRHSTRFGFFYTHTLIVMPGRARRDGKR
ncbi:MAG: hypothetical protein BGN95_12825 [Sphingomonas sp. 66-10]|nr:MAG: hypothetical protein BGN95_12825 [Sphingomonas sp. 66-10]